MWPWNDSVLCHFFHTSVWECFCITMKTVSGWQHKEKVAHGKRQYNSFLCVPAEVKYMNDLLPSAFIVSQSVILSMNCIQQNMSCTFLNIHSSMGLKSVHLNSFQIGCCLAINRIKADIKLQHFHGIEMSVLRSVWSSLHSYCC